MSNAADAAEKFIQSIAAGEFEAARQFRRGVRRRLADNTGLERHDFSSNRHPALSFCSRMIFSENRYPLFRVML
jgi:hypothetical protein